MKKIIIMIFIFIITNNIMKVLLYGAKGWIGGQFLDILANNNIEYIKGESRVDNDIMLEKEIKESIKRQHK